MDFYFQYTGGNLHILDTKTTAAEMLEASRKIEFEENAYSHCNSNLPYIIKIFNLLVIFKKLNYLKDLKKRDKIKFTHN